MTKSLLHRGTVAMLLLALAAAPTAYAATPCTATANTCIVSNDATESSIQIGGAGSLSSNDDCGAVDCDDPGKLDDGTVAEATFDFAFVRSTATLTLTITNTTATTSSLTAVYFNAPDAVTSVTLDSLSLSKTPPPVLTTWTAILDPANIAAAGFGRLDVYVGNGGDTGNGGGNPLELLAGESLVLDLILGGDLSAVTACSFTSEGSKIPPGEFVVTAVGRFQSGLQGGSGWISPCTGDDLYVDLKSFAAEPADGGVVLNWETATELDNLGFNVLRRPEIGGGPWEIVNAGLVPARGNPLAGAVYSLEDTSVVNGVRYHYRLEDIDLSGFNTLHTPEMAVPNPQAPPIKLTVPEYGHSFLADEAIRLSWNTGLRGPLRVQFSADAGFPESSRVEFPARAGRFGSTQEMTLNPHERMLVQSVLSDAEEGQVYWRVVESPKGNHQGGQSDVFRFGTEE